MSLRVFDTCVCGMARSDCDYHRDGPVNTRSQSAPNAVATSATGATIDTTLWLEMRDANGAYQKLMDPGPLALVRSWFTHVPSRLIGCDSYVNNIEIHFPIMGTSAVVTSVLFERGTYKFEPQLGRTNYYIYPGDQLLFSNGTLEIPADVFERLFPC